MTDITSANNADITTEIGLAIKHVLAICSTRNPLELLAHLALTHCVVEAETYRESTSKNRPHYVEYALSLCIGIENPTFNVDPNLAEYVNVTELIELIYEKVYWYFGSKIFHTSKSPEEAEVRFGSLTDFLAVRGSGYPAHLLDQIGTTYTPHDSFLSSTLGFKTGDVISGVKEIFSQIEEKVNTHPLIAARQTLSQRLAKYLESESSVEIDISHLPIEFSDRPENQQILQVLAAEPESQLADVFTLVPNERLLTKVLEALSAEFGENKEFVSFARSPGWPTNDSVIHEKPLVLVGGRFYCFYPNLLRNSLYRIMERWIRNSSESYFLNTFQKKRSDQLESDALKYLSCMLPGANVYKKLFFSFVDGGQEYRPEIDGLVAYDRTLLVVEAKSGGVSVSARRGGIGSIGDTIKDQIEAGARQAQRTINFLKAQKNVRFEYQDRTTATEIHASDFENMYAIVPTLETLEPLTTQLNVIRELGYLKDIKGWPWCVGITDLRVISEIVELSSEFLLYLERRTSSHDLAQLSSHDELDYFMWFLNTGLYFDSEDATQYDKIWLTPRTEDLDRYYAYLTGDVSTGSKPRLQISDSVRRLIEDIERSKQPRFSELSTLILATNGKTQDMIANSLQRLKANLDWPGEERSYSISLKQGPGMTLWVGQTLDYKTMLHLDQTCLSHKYETRCDRWYLLARIGSDGRIKLKAYSKVWEWNPEFEAGLKKRRSRAIKVDELSPSDDCYCGSSKTYKDCCLSSQE